MASINCARCGGVVAGPGPGLPWCAAGGIWLVQDEPTGEWVSVAEREHRRRQAGVAVRVQESHDQVHGGLAAAQASLPDRWQAAAHQPVPDADWSIIIHPPAGPVQIAAYLYPPDADSGWYVRIDNRSEGVCFPLYIPGGARAAHFAALDRAVDATVTALRTATR